jgi:putative membrane protein
MNYYYAPFGWIGMLAMVFWWVAVVIGLVALVRWLAPRERNMRDDEKSPMEILKERYAKGEIDRREFEEKKKDLI